MDRSSLFEEVLSQGILQRERAIKKGFLKSFRHEIERLFEETNDVNVIYKRVLEFLDNCEASSREQYGY